MYNFKDCKQNNGFLERVPTALQMQTFCIFWKSKKISSTSGYGYSCSKDTVDRSLKLNKMKTENIKTIIVSKLY